MEETIFTFIGWLVGHGPLMVIGHIIIVVAIIVYLANKATQKLSVVPKGWQNVMEAYLGGVIAMGKDVVGEKYARKYLPLVATIGLFVFFSNVLGIIPGFESPTANINVTLPLAIAVFVYYNYEGIKKNGVVKYFKHFMGPVPALAPLMFPIEVVSHFSRIISLSFRLFGNIKGDDLFLWVLLMLTPWIIPLVPMAMLSFMAVLQTFIFMILTYVYLAGAVLMDEHHEDPVEEMAINTPV
ncbi:MAG: F0F1 ATP synthase subunit A [Epsilonproteobacteria bacterium]|nr:F0F1 ATP synthase subunit A [Campylobacterota bacterium]